MTIETLAKQGRESIHTGLAGIDIAKMKQMRNQGLRECFMRLNDMRYRKEFVATIHGKQFINDAAGRTPNATWYAIDSTDGIITWITNGDVDQDYRMLTPTLSKKVTRIICIGSSRYLRRDLPTQAHKIQEAGSIAEAVSMAFYGSFEKEIVLFSPACGLNDMAEEGRMFQYEVNEL